MKTATKENVKLGTNLFYINKYNCEFLFSVTRMTDKSVWVSNGVSSIRKSWKTISKYSIV